MTSTHSNPLLKEQPEGQSKSSQTFDPSTLAVRAGIESDTQYGAVVSPIYLSANFSFAGFNNKRIYDYTRSGNPTRDQLGNALAVLESGAEAVITNSGMSAILLVTRLLSRGDLLVAPHDCYGGTYRLFEALAKKGDFELEFIDQTDQAKLKQALARKPKLIWIETPSNPLLRIVDIRAISTRAHETGTLVAVDNTFLSPAIQRPITLGADIVVHSTTKYINGHSDIIGGAVISASSSIGSELTWWANCLGLTGSPFDSYLALRGLHTLHARIQFHQQNAIALVELLTKHPAVERVFHPSISTHPGHQIAKTQQNGFGAMISFELKDGPNNVQNFLTGLRCFTLAESLGGVESLVAHPATMTHASMGEEGRNKAGIRDNLIRLSVGIESTADLRTDLEQALNRALGR